MVVFQKKFSKTFFKRFTAADRANLLHVSYQLAFSGSKTYATPSVLTSYLDVSELDYVPWKVFCFHIERMARILNQNSAFLSVSVILKKKINKTIRKYRVNLYFVIWKNKAVCYKYCEKPGRVLWPVVE